MKVWPGQTTFVTALLVDIVANMARSDNNNKSLMVDIIATLARSDHINFSILGIYWCKSGQVGPYLL